MGTEHSKEWGSYIKHRDLFFLLLLLWRFQSLIPRIEKEEKGILKLIFATSIFLHPKFSVGFTL